MKAIYVFAVATALALPASAYSAIRYVSNTGTDAANCGIDAATACRSITKGIAVAALGDTVQVGPGRYGDLNFNGVLGDFAGEETGSPGCGCVLSINRNVIVVSSAGAAVTLIDGRTVDVGSNVLLITNGGEFGRPGKGFTVTETARSVPYGIALDSANVLVRGNQVINTRTNFSGTGIVTVNDASVTLEGNQVLNWFIGISGRGAAIVSKNQVIRNYFGISATGGTVTGNVATNNQFGFDLTGNVTVTLNASYMNFLGFGVSLFTGVFTKNNIMGHRVCGLINYGVNGLNATNNYWGAATGPGTPSADYICNEGSTTNYSPWATKPFTVRILKP